MQISFLFLNKNICCGYSLEAPRRGASNEYPQHMYLLRNKKNIMWIPPLICSYATTLWADKADDKLMILFFFFLRKKALTFHVNCLLRRQICIHVCRSLFSEKNKKNISKCCLLKFLPRVLSVKTLIYWPAFELFIHVFVHTFSFSSKIKTKLVLCILFHFPVIKRATPFTD